MTLFIAGKLQEPAEPMQPTAELSVPAGPVSLCNSITIEMTNIQGTGRRNLQKIQWSLSQVSPKNTTVMAALSDLCQLATNLQLMQLVIPMLTMGEFGTYQFQVRFENYRES
jgi:hypothetical protein